MYFPYFRGKQYELVTIRENAERLAQAGFTPIIEPVRDALGGLDRALAAVRAAQGRAIVIVNPRFGSLREDGEAISALLRERYAGADVSAGILLTEAMTVDDIVAICGQHLQHQVSLVHAGFSHGRELATTFRDRGWTFAHFFVSTDDNLLYRRHFTTGTKVRIRDGFNKRRRNLDYPFVEKFSELHATFDHTGLNGFGDFLTVGDDYAEGGGPAYSVAIHLTFVDEGEDDAMFVYHFKSQQSDTPGDPGAKFAEALQLLYETINQPDSRVYETNAIAEFRSLHDRGHFPGLGYVKKLSMQHHIETMAQYFALRRS
ncbi:sce7725 family protein [Achromobacter arsenitoxydans]|uniref:Uncharacterized protein n=1 Tax=Achromobacter arsenitoxydans SY8 TaxID=477184 RepID=H0F887_9BURK|nr:sce7725 family protein [Achromobacter arsenitoxydans]EHK65520.1 hypothetical protein KYC_14927 [Achromobacter arsenitoxydans SY8]